MLHFEQSVKTPTVHKIVFLILNFNFNQKIVNWQNMNQFLSQIFYFNRFYIYFKEHFFNVKKKEQT